MTIMDMVEALGSEVRRALPTVLTPERLTRTALLSANNTPELAECAPISFIVAFLNAAQLGLEPNTPLGQAYLISCRNKDKLGCQFQLDYKELIDLAYRTGQVRIVQAQVVRKFDSFEYQYSFNSKLVHKPREGARGEITYVYGLSKLSNGGYGFEVSNKMEMDAFTARYLRSFGNKYNPWTEDYESMAERTAIKRVSKYAPISSDFRKVLSIDETIKTGIVMDMSEIRNECLPEGAGPEAT